MFEQIPQQNANRQNKIEKKIEETESEQKEKPSEQLTKLLEKISDDLEKEGLPIDKKARIDSKFFEKVYSQKEIEGDQKKIEELEKQWYKNKNPQQIETEKEHQIGEKLEATKTVILNKFMGDRFYVMRTNRYDDVFNKVDNVIMDKKNGEIVCAFDEVADIKDKRFYEKRDKVLARNQKGVQLKYGLKMENQEILPSPVKKLPIFYIALPQKYLDKCLNALIPNLDTKTEEEKMFFNYTLMVIDHEIQTLNKSDWEIDDSVLEKIENFSQTIKNYEKINDLKKPKN